MVDRSMGVARAPRRMRWREALAVAMLAIAVATGSAALAARASAASNDGVAQAQGPLVGGHAYSGQLASANALDTYLFYVSGQAALDVHVTATGSEGFGSCVEVSLNNEDNQSLGEGTSTYLAGGKSTDLTYTTPEGVNRYYLELSPGSEGCHGSYTFTIEPASAIVAGPATPTQQAVEGLHESAPEAFGPLSAGIGYTDVLQTTNDQNWLTFITPPGNDAVDLEMTLLTDGCSPGGVAAVYAASHGPEGAESAPLEYDAWTHVSFTSTQAERYYVGVGPGGETNCAGARWEVVVDKGALASSLPPASPPPSSGPVVSPPPACVVPQIAAGSTKKRAEHAIKAAHCTVGGLARAHSSKVRRGRVLRLSPGAGTFLPSGAHVKIVLSSGRRHAARGGRRRRAGYIACDKARQPDYPSLRRAPRSCVLGLAASNYDAQPVKGHPKPAVLKLTRLRWSHWGAARAKAHGRACNLRTHRCARVRVLVWHPARIMPAGGARIYQRIRVRFAGRLEWYEPGTDY